MKVKKILLAASMLLLGLGSLEANNDNNPKSAFAQLSSSVTQISQAPALVSLENFDAINNLSVEDHNTIVIQEKGNYYFSVNAHVGNQSLIRAGTVKVWLNRNGNVIPSSIVCQTLSESRTKESVSTQAIVGLNHGDTLSIGYSSTAPGLGLKAIAATETDPGVPSITVSLFRVN